MAVSPLRSALARALDVRLLHARRALQPNVMDDAPPGGLDTRLDDRSVRKLPTFCESGRA